ncbi:MAG: DUF4931 domain-containing protein [bacterium]|nr:DUF4931 domain-containing protein [bacterium]
MVSADEHAPRTVEDPFTGRPILLSPVRRSRPMHTGPRTTTVAKPCPFCHGNEAETPPEVGAVRDAEGRWLTRAFANKYPASAHHEVIAEGADHCEQPGDLDRTALLAMVELWQQRIVALERRPDVQCAFLFKNVGGMAGASIAHNHSQILGLPAPPPRIELEATRAAALDGCPWCDTIERAPRDGRLVFAADSHVVLCPDPAKLPHETWLLPRRCDDDFLTTDAESLVTALQQLFVAVARTLDRPAFNFWLHRNPTRPFHWHFELQPRTGQVAGLELGGDMYINSFPAVTAAARLREGLDQ